jgi:tripartite-type tricarboxylate transporter receptor subunit TctC
MIAPKGTSPQIIARLSQACAEAVTTPSFEATLKTLQIPQGYLPAKDFDAFVRSEYQRYGELIEIIGAKIK